MVNSENSRIARTQVLTILHSSKKKIYIAEWQSPCVAVYSCNLSFSQVPKL